MSKINAGESDLREGALAAVDLMKIKKWHIFYLGGLEPKSAWQVRIFSAHAFKRSASFRSAAALCRLRRGDDVRSRSRLLVCPASLPANAVSSWRLSLPRLLCRGSGGGHAKDHGIVW
jgi:hypothetical protein